ncbi:hypothetical protein [Halobellus ordinarius]|uniref:hypothetical protein n=1 Tax=Halobellus ordinarius TaxID=3075120 RepID=UPI002880296A|nr:hypothetical protein [Halobellus sp. ZY16]
MPSSTPALTRRRLIQAAAALGATALAGCGGSSSASGSTREVPAAGPPDDALNDPPHVSLRQSELKPIVVTESTPTDDTETGTGAETIAEADKWHQILVADAETAESLTIADVDGAESARQFIAETDFDAETVYVERHVTPECYERRLCWINWTESRIETEYARVLRDADVACEADAEDVLTTLIRIPAALDPDSVQRYSSGGGGGPCPRPETEQTEAGDS